MFATLKSKIKEETGSDIASLTQQNSNRMRSFSSTMSMNSANDDILKISGTHNNNNNTQLTFTYASEELSSLRGQCNDLTTKVTDLMAQVDRLLEEKTRLEKTNEILLETVKVAQTQKDIYCEEQEKIQNIQQHEIDKLKSLLSFREQEAVDRLSAMHQSQHQVENLTSELERLKPLEAVLEDVRDELQQLRHSTHQERNSLNAALAAADEEKRNLKTRLQIMEQARLDALPTLNADEKFQAFMHERKLLEQHLEEAHLQLSDIKSSWSGTNLALETQVSRLSKQVAEETTEKRKVLKAKDDLNEKVKQLEFDAIKLTEHMNQRDMKIKLLEEEIDELNLALKECREQSEQQVLFERNRASVLESETEALKNRLDTLNERFEKSAADANNAIQALQQQNTQLNEQTEDVQHKWEAEKDEKDNLLLKNAEISQSESMLRKELRSIQTEMKAKQQELADCKLTLDELKNAMHKNESKLKEIDNMQREISDKNKTVKMLNQRLADLKKTLQKEFQQHSVLSDVGICDLSNTRTSSTNSNCHCGGAPIGTAIIMDEVNFKYLKHVIVKFLTSREVEARHLIRAVATLLHLSKDEEKLLHDTINWKMSWFGSKPDHGSGQRAFSIPPS